MARPSEPGIKLAQISFERIEHLFYNGYREKLDQNERKANSMDQLLVGSRPARWLYHILFRVLCGLALGR